MGASLAIGAGRLALDRATQYARERTVWKAPIGTHQAISHPLAEAKIEIELAALMLRKATALYDAGAKGAGEASNMAKYAAAEAANHAWTAPSRPTAATASRSSTASATCGGACASCGSRRSPTR